MLDNDAYHPLVTGLQICYQFQEIYCSLATLENNRTVLLRQEVLCIPEVYFFSLCCRSRETVVIRWRL